MVCLQMLILMLLDVEVPICSISSVYPTYRPSHSGNHSGVGFPEKFENVEAFKYHFHRNQTNNMSNWFKKKVAILFFSNFNKS